MEQNTNEQASLNNSEFKPPIKKIAFIILAMFIVALLSLTAGFMICRNGNNIINLPDIFTGDENKKSVGKKEVNKFANYEEVKKFLEENPISAANFSSSYGGLGSLGLGSARRSEAIPTWGSGESAPQGVPSSFGNPFVSNIILSSDKDYSTTNIQVGGVDEDDIVKNDGKYIYAISGNNVQIIEAYPASESKIVSTIRLNSAPKGIYLNGNKLAVYGQNTSISREEFYKSLKPIRTSSGFTYLKIYDTSDKKNPKEEKDLDFEGSYSSSRMIGDYIYFITTNSKYNYYAFDKETPPVPMIIENGKMPDYKDAKCKGGCPDVYYLNIPYKSYNFTTVSAINISDKNKETSSNVFLLDGNQNTIFVSNSNIYITFTKYITEGEITANIIKEIVLPKLSEDDNAKIAEINNTKGYVLSPAEKSAKVDLIIAGYYESLSRDDQKNIEKEIQDKTKQKYEDISKEIEKTKVHKIAIDKDKIEYKVSGEVTGQVLNQFSMNEDNNYFYIATTKNRTWSQFSSSGEQDSYSNIYILDKDMKVSGKVENIAKGEKIYSVRFMQKRAYMVTFRQTDPLFVIDLSDAKSPRILGELKVPGYSGYLHPYDEMTLIGLGKEADERGVIIGGVKLSLFDVSDVNQPKEIDKYPFGGKNSNSAAINDHKAFLFSKDKNLLVIPVSLRADYRLIAPEREKMEIPVVENDFDGAAVFNIDKKGFVLKGKIDHGSAPALSGWGSSYSTNYNSNIQRSLYINDMLYTLSKNFIKANSLSDLTEIKKIDLVSGR